MRSLSFAALALSSLLASAAATGFAHAVREVEDRDDVLTIMVTSTITTCPIPTTPPPPCSTDGSAPGTSVSVPPTTSTVLTSISTSSSVVPTSTTSTSVASTSASTSAGSSAATASGTSAASTTASTTAVETSAAETSAAAATSTASNASTSTGLTSAVSTSAAETSAAAETSTASGASTSAGTTSATSTFATSTFAAETSAAGTSAASVTSTSAASAETSAASTAAETTAANSTIASTSATSTSAASSTVASTNSAATTAETTAAETSVASTSAAETSAASTSATQTTTTAQTTVALTSTASAVSTSAVSTSAVSTSAISTTAAETSSVASTTAANSTIASTSAASSTVASTSVASTTSAASTSAASTSAASTTAASTTAASTTTSVPQPACTDYWLSQIKHQGFAPYATTANYTVFRNVQDYGAKGDGIADDTAAINKAISDQGRCGPNGCVSTTTTPALVYFPPGTYRVTSPIINYYFTQIFGNPDCMPVIKAASNFQGAWVFDANQYQNTGRLGWGSTDVFWRQVRNLVIDLTGLNPSADVGGIHWPSSQATSLQNILVKMATGPNVRQFGMLIEEGSGGYIGDMVFQGGLDGMRVGNQQFTMKNLTFNGAQTAIRQSWSWGWTYSSISIINCGVGLDLTNIDAATDRLPTASITFIDSEIINTKVGIATGRLPAGQNDPDQANTLIVENVRLSNVPVAIQGPNQSTLLAGSSSSTTIAGWGQGNRYSATTKGPTAFQGPITPFARPAGLTAGTHYYERSRPSYSELPASQFLSVKTAGAKGDGVTDDTVAINAAVLQAVASGKVLFFDYGMYVVTSTVYIPAGARITGEALPVIISQGAFFNDMASPKPVVQVGKAGERGAAVEWSDMVVSTRGQQAGAILIEWNLASDIPSAMWDVHTRVGGFAGSNLQARDCPKTPNVKVDGSNLNENCIAAFMSMHITASAANLLNENCWLWVADHDVERENGMVQITIYAGRGLLVESTAGNIWLWGSGVEHHQLYEYQFVNTRNVFAGQIQTETAYYQPNPDATIPFPVDARFSDPVLKAGESGWGVRAVDSQDIVVYGAGLYSFFDNYDKTCAQESNGQTCQTRIMDINNSHVSVYNLNTVGVGNQITIDGVDIARYEDNKNGFVNTVAIFTS